MNFFRKSLIVKLLSVFFLIFFLILIFSLYSHFYGDKVVPYYALIFTAVLYSVLFLGFYYRDVIKPLKDVVVEMQALLSGSEFKSIYTTRIDEIGVIAFFFNQVIKSLGKVSFDIKDRQRMLDELNIAAEIQRDILPMETPVIKGLSVVAKNRAASEVGGDSFNIINSKDKVYIYIGDVTGHGVAAGLIMTMVNSLISVFAEFSESAYEILKNTNKHIKKHIKKAMYMTVVLLCWDIEKQKMTYVGAGHEYILVYRKAIGTIESIVSGGIALGMVPDNSMIIKEKEIFLNDGDFVILYSDGITEARNIDDELYGLDRLISSVKTYAPEFNAEGLNYKIAMDVSAFMKGRAQLDDMTLIVIQKISDTLEISKKPINTNW
jgi:hypothetical protein